MEPSELRVEYSDKDVTAWGGMKLMHDLVERMGIKDHLRALPVPSKGSNRGYDPVQIIESFWVSIWIGASRFTHSELLRYDKTLKEIFGWDHVPSQSTFSRFFHKFSWKRNNELFEPLFRWFFEQLTFDNLTLDLDSTVMTRYGTQEGAKVGYNPQKRGRASHHPLMAFMADLRMVVNAWMRPGNTGSSSNYKNFLMETLGILQNKRVGLVRADSGFFSEDFCNEMEIRKLNYVTAVPMYPVIKSEIWSQQGWVEVSHGIEVVEWMYRLPSWKQARRMIAVRKRLEIYPKASGKLLLFGDDVCPRYRYSAFVTNLDLPAELVWNLYRDRGDAENRIKELKYDFGADSFCLSEFFATEAAFRFILIAYNLMSVFRQVVLKSKNQATLSTLRFKCFALGAWISKHANQRVLKIALAREKRAWLDGLFNIARSAAPPYNFSNA
jgi:hypothetical protein